MRRLSPTRSVGRPNLAWSFQTSRMGSTSEMYTDDMHYQSNREGGKTVFKSKTRRTNIELTMMTWVSNGKSGSGSLHLSEDLTNVLYLTLDIT